MDIIDKIGGLSFYAGFLGLCTMATAAIWSRDQEYKIGATVAAVSGITFAAALIIYWVEDEAAKRKAAKALPDQQVKL